MIIDTSKMKLYDISLPIAASMPVYKGLEVKRPILSTDMDFNKGKAYESRLEMNLHTGTHIDRPLHMIPGGDTMNTLPLSQVVTPCRVLDLTEAKDKVTKEELLKKDIPMGSFLLLKTRNSYENLLEKDFIYLDRTGAEYLQERKVIGVGIDSLGIERSQPDHETHIRLLGSGAVILEGLQLKDIEEGEYLLSAAPLNIEGVEAAPVRAYLFKS